MSDELLCPICIERPIQYYTECNHGYCIECLCRISRCALCRNNIQRAKLCIQIKLKFKKSKPKVGYRTTSTSGYRTTSTSGYSITRTDGNITSTVTILRNGDLYHQAYARVSIPEMINEPNFRHTHV
jgi:hypothetical protein